MKQKRLQRSGNSRRVKKEMDLQQPFLFSDHRRWTTSEEMRLWSPPKKRQEGARGYGEDCVEREGEEEKKMHGGWKPEGETEMRETKSRSGRGGRASPVNPDGEGHHERWAS